MTTIRACNKAMIDAALTRHLVCARCGKQFECGPPGDCWCAAEPYRLPMTEAGAEEDCLCPACLRQAAAAQATR
jgi:hypothetical protein